MTVFSYKNSKEYKKKWSDFRKRIIERDNDMCVKCKRSNPDAILQVHHKKYIKGRMPWDYPEELCETLCKGCHAIEHGKIPPNMGWEFLFEDDLSGLTGNCKYCGTNIRYVFSIFHHKWGVMEVGTICCDNLTATKLASNSMESKTRYPNRLKRFIESTRWSYRDGVYKIKQRGFTIKVISYNNYYILYIDEVKGKIKYRTLQEAQTKSFEVVEHRSFQNKHTEKI
jgi:hypothetical protein